MHSEHSQTAREVNRGIGGRQRLTNLLVYHRMTRNANVVHKQSLNALERLAIALTDKVGPIGFFLSSQGGPCYGRDTTSWHRRCQPVSCYLVPGPAVSSKCEPPRGKPVASKEGSSYLSSSNHHETPPDKPVVSLKSFHTERQYSCTIDNGRGVSDCSSGSVQIRGAVYGPNLCLYSPETRNALTISALTKLPLNWFSFRSQKS